MNVEDLRLRVKPQLGPMRLKKLVERKERRSGARQGAEHALVGMFRHHLDLCIPRRFDRFDRSFSRRLSSWWTIGIGFIRITKVPSFKNLNLTLMATIPKDIQDGFKRAGARSAFADLAPSRRKKYVDWIQGAKRPETRKARVEKAAKMMLQKRRR